MIGPSARSVARDRLLSLVLSEFAISRGSPQPLGSSVVREGVNFAIFSASATRVTLVLYAQDEAEPAVELPLDPRVHRTGDVWHIMLDGLEAGVAYGFRLDGPSGIAHRFDPSCVVLDPHARAVIGGEVWGQQASPRRSIVVHEPFDWGFDQPLNTPLSQTVIYELHVRGFTADPSSGVRHPGTFDGLIEKIPYLQSLGITAVELMPITEFNEMDVPSTVNPVTGERLLNFWGYHPLSFFAPKSSYAADRRPAGAVREFKRMVQSLHAAGIEVIVDLVFNHTGEGGSDGTTSSFRGIDNATYYITDPATGAYRDYSGCGNTLNCNHPVVRDLILECLRYWVVEMHVDGFRFDLASVLGRGRDGALLANPPLLERIAADPILAHTKLIAEAWDAAGAYQVGSFPAWGRWAEWNGRFRDDIRRFVKGNDGLAASIATRLAGSPDLYRWDGRSAHHSINFITSHDGFTLADLVSFNGKHNEGNGENSRDGCNDNDSWNCGWEGPTVDHSVRRLREKQQRNMLALLFLAQGVPMLLAGDEYGRSQGGNNNAYCQDSPTSWLSWDAARRDHILEGFVRRLIKLRHTHASLRQANFLDAGSDGKGVVDWHGRTPFAPDWSASSRLVVVRFVGNGSSDLLIAINADWQSIVVSVPPSSHGGAWRKILDTNAAQDGGDLDAEPQKPERVLVAARSLVLLEAEFGNRDSER